ncbi:MAG: type II CAAX endopeptidase family protein [Verrucomicrobiota bacterium]|jgi:hypothetical protein|nr:type II CAAX endopeptidase family protein [Verrucomicrobiota bacterium]
MDPQDNGLEDPGAASSVPEPADIQEPPKNPVKVASDDYPQWLLPPIAPPALTEPLGDTPPPLPENFPPLMFTPKKVPTDPVSPWVVVGLIGLMGASILGLFFDGEFGHLLKGSWDTCLFTTLAVLAYAGRERPWAQWMSWLMLGGIVTLAAFFNFAICIEALADDGQGISLRDTHQAFVLMLVLFLSWACLIPALLPALRRSPLGIARLEEAAGWTNIRLLALGTTVSLMLSCCVPLVILGEPPILAALQRSARFAADMTGNRGAAGLLRDQLYGLVWILLGAALAVGWGITRDAGQTLRRLGLERIPIQQLRIAVLSPALLFVLGDVLDRLITWIWGALGWRITDASAVEALFSAYTTPLGAIVIGVTAGLGEEIAVRGILQPRLGILLSNCLFTAMHAYQYHWDGLCSVFVIGLALGWIRKRTNTTVSAIAHGGYDFLLILLEYLGAH